MVNCAKCFLEVNQDHTSQYSFYESHKSFYEHFKGACDHINFQLNFCLKDCKKIKNYIHVNHNGNLKGDHVNFLKF